MDEQETETEQVTEEVETSVEATTEPAERTFTQAELNKFLAKETSKLKRKMSREAKEKAVSAPAHTEESNDQNERLDQLLETVESLKARLDEQQTSSKVKNLLASYPGLSDEHAGMVATMYKTDAAQATKLAELFSKSSESAPEPSGPGFKSPGAPAPTPEIDRALDPRSWTKDDISRMRSDGSFKANLEKYRNSLPGGGGGLFRKPSKR